MDQDFDDRLSLDLEQGVMLWCVRSWVAGLQQPNGSADQIAKMVECLGAPDASPYLDGFMSALSHGAIRKIGIACTCCARVAPDERMLLDVMGLAQHGRPLEATMLLRGLLSPKSARAALRSAEGLGTELALAGWFLAVPDAPASQYIIAPEHFSVSRPSGGLLH